MHRWVGALLVLGAASSPAPTLEVTGTSFVPGATLSVPPTQITITLSAPPDPTSVNLASVVLIRAGADHLLGTADDVTVLPNSVTVSGNQIVLDLSGLTLPNDLYQLTVRGNDLAISGLVDWWKLDDGSGSTAVDSAGSANGTLGGGGGTSPTWTTGRLGGGLSFAGNDNRVLMGAADLPVPWTAGMWVNRQNSTASDARLMDSSAGSLRLEQFNGTKEVGVTVYGSVDTPFSYTAPIGQWAHLLFVGEATGTSLYVNGAFVQKVGTVLACPRNTLGSSGFNSMVGVLDDVRVYSRTLLPIEITAVAGLGGAVRDLSGNALDGEFTGTFPSGDGNPGGDFVATFTLSAAPPRVTSMTPVPGTSVPAPPTVTLVLDHPVDPATVSGATMSVVRAGPDGILGTADDVTIVPSSISVSGGTSIVLALPGGLPPDLYQVTASGTLASLPAPVNSWSLDDALGTTATDSAGGLNGTLGGNGGTLPVWTNGKLGTALSFAGSDNRVYLAGSDLAAPFTATMWVYHLNSVVEDARLMDSNAYSLRLEQYNQTKEVGVTVYGSVDSPFSYTAPLGQWTHLAFVGTSGGTSLYVNGAFVQTLSTAIGCPRTALGSGGYNSMVGTLDEVNVYGSTLSAAQIGQIAALGGAVRSTGALLLDGEFAGTFPSGNGVAGGDFVATFTVTSAVPPPPLAPANLVAQSGDAEVTLTWTPSGGASSYNVKRGTASGTEVGIATGVTAPGYIDTGLANGTTYFYVVTAVNAGGESAPSNEASATPALPAGSGALLANLTAGGCGALGLEAVAVWIAVRAWFRRRRRGIPRVPEILLVLFVLSGGATLLGQEEKPPAGSDPAPTASEGEKKESAPKAASDGGSLPLPTSVADEDGDEDLCFFAVRGGAWLHPAFHASTSGGARTLKGAPLGDVGADLGYYADHWVVELSYDEALGRNVEAWLGGIRAGLVEALPLEGVSPFPILAGLSAGVIGGRLGVDLPGFGDFRGAWGFQTRGEIFFPLNPRNLLSVWAEFRAIGFRYEPAILSGDRRAFGGSVALGGGLTIGF